MTPALYRVVGRRTETEDVTTLSLSPVAGGSMAFRSGQFNMLTAFGVGEAAISVSSAPTDDGPLRHTVREVGSVTRALCKAQVGDVIGVRGPFGTHWDAGDPDAGDPDAGDGGAGDRDTPDVGGDVVVVAGGIGLAPLRGAVYELVERRVHRGGRVFVVVGARAPSQVIFPDDLETWARSGAEVAVTVDVSEPGWTGHVGLVTSLLGGAGFDPARTTAARVRARDHDAIHGPHADRRGRRPQPDTGVVGTQHAMRGGLVRALPAGAPPVVP